MADRREIGRIGRTGSKGDKGDKGDTGRTGDTGDTGVKVVGVPGQGLKGDTGEQGERGTTGTTGLQGEHGDTGQAGGIGRTGETGSKGARGEAGTVGTTGAQGEQGEPGVTSTLTVIQLNAYVKRLESRYRNVSRLLIVGLITVALAFTIAEIVTINQFQERVEEGQRDRRNAIVALCESDNTMSRGIISFLEDVSTPERVQLGIETFPIVNCQEKAAQFITNEVRDD